MGSRRERGMPRQVGERVVELGVDGAATLLRAAPADGPQVGRSGRGRIRGACSRSGDRAEDAATADDKAMIPIDMNLGVIPCPSG